MSLDFTYFLTTLDSWKMFVCSHSNWFSVVVRSRKDHKINCPSESTLLYIFRLHFVSLSVHDCFSVIWKWRLNFLGLEQVQEMVIERFQRFECSNWPKICTFWQYFDRHVGSQIQLMKCFQILRQFDYKLNDSISIDQKLSWISHFATLMSRNESL